MSEQQQATPMIVPLKRIELDFIPPFYIMRLGQFINLWDENGFPLKPVIVSHRPTKEPLHA